MSQASNHLEELALNWIFTTGTATRPTAWHVGLYTSNPADDNSGTELTIGTNGYTRESATFSAATTDGTKHSVKNSADITFGPANGGNWGLITHVAVHDASTGGNMLAYAQLDTSKTVSDGDTFVIQANNLTISLD